MKHFYFVFAVLLSLGLLAACGQGNTSEEQNSEASVNEESEDTGTEEEQQTEEETNQDTSDSTQEDNSESDSEEEVQDNASSEEAAENTDSEEGTVTETVNLYFPDEQLLETYKVQKEVEAENESQLPKATLQEWIDGPDKEGLVSFFNGDVEVQSVEGQDGTAMVSFSKQFLETNVGSTGEAFITEQIALMMKQFGYDQTKILIDGEEQSTLFGHMDATEPISAGNPEDYNTME